MNIECHTVVKWPTWVRTMNRRGFLRALVAPVAAFYLATREPVVRESGNLLMGYRGDTIIDEGFIFVPHDQLSRVTCGVRHAVNPADIVNPQKMPLLYATPVTPEFKPRGVQLLHAKPHEL